MKQAQALASLIIFVAIAITVITATIIIVGSNTVTATISQQMVQVRQAAESGLENALLRLLRDPSYSGETIPANVNGFETTISVTGDDINKTIISTAANNNYQRKIKVKINYNENIMTVNFWQDIQ